MLKERIIFFYLLKTAKGLKILWLYCRCEMDQTTCKLIRESLESSFLKYVCKSDPSSITNEQRLFTLNSYKADAKSLITGSIFYLLSIKTIVHIWKGSTNFSATLHLISIIFSATLWYKWGDQPVLLAQKAVDAIFEKNKKKLYKLSKMEQF